MDDKDSSPTVVYIGGYRRIGSTLLGIVLGSHPHYVHVGEMSFLYSTVRSPSRTACACDEPLRHCPFWDGVAARYKNYTGRLLLSPEAWSLQRHIERRRGILRVLASDFTNRRRFARYRAHVRGLFRAVAEEGASKVIDSSKSTAPATWRALLLSSLAGLDVRLIHLVRDGRGVTWSARKGANKALESGGRRE